MIWVLEDAGSGRYRIKNVRNGKYLEAFYNSSGGNTYGGLTLEPEASSSSWGYSSSKLDYSEISGTTTKYLTYDDFSDVQGGYKQNTDSSADLFTVRSTGNADNIYFYEVSTGSGGSGGSGVTNTPVEITSSSTGSGNSKNVSIPVNSTLSVTLTNGSGNQKSYTISNNNSGIASISPSDGFTLSGNGEKTFTIQGLAVGETVITFTGTSSSGGTYKATINLTVTASGGSGGSGASNASVSITASTSGATANATISVGGTLTITLKNGSSNPLQKPTTTVVDNRSSR